MYDWVNSSTISKFTNNVKENYRFQYKCRKLAFRYYFSKVTCKKVDPFYIVSENLVELHCKDMWKAEHLSNELVCLDEIS